MCVENHGRRQVLVLNRVRDSSVLHEQNATTHYLLNAKPTQRARQKPIEAASL